MPWDESPQAKVQDHIPLTPVPEISLTESGWPVESGAEQVSKNAISWGDIAKTRSNPRPRVRMFCFDADRTPTTNKDKFGPGRDQFIFPVVEKGVDHGSLATASKGLMDQIREEVVRYDAGGALFTRTYLLLREGDGMKTTYLLRGYDLYGDASTAYDKMIAYLQTRGE